MYREKGKNIWKWNSYLFGKYGQWECSVACAGIGTEDCHFSVKKKARLK